jgi:hypothetical protein
LFSACTTGGANWVLNVGATTTTLVLTSSSTLVQYSVPTASFNCLGTSTFTKTFQSGNGCNFPATVTTSPF